MNNTAAFRTGIWISVGLAVLDIAGLFTVGMEDAPPTAAILTGAGLGVVTLLAIRPAFRASRTGLATSSCHGRSQPCSASPPTSPARVPRPLPRSRRDS